MEDRWKRNNPLPYSEMPLYTDVFINFMEDGRKSKKMRNNCESHKNVVTLQPNHNTIITHLIKEVYDVRDNQTDSDTH